MLVLGIESTAHTFGVGLVDEHGTVLANARRIYHPKSGSGIIPWDAEEHHRTAAPIVLAEALQGRTPDLIVYSKGPGLPPCLKVGIAVAKELAKKYQVPIVGANHCIAHVEIGKVATGAKDPVTLYVSGGNTQVLALSDGRYRVFGETLDIPIGNALDVFARNLGLPFPGGPEIERLAKEGKNLLKLPYVVKGMDLSYSGLLTHCRRLAEQDTPKSDICYSFQEYAFAMLTEVTERALAHVAKDEVLLTGGVAANKRLQEMVRTMAEERGAKFYNVPLALAGDNGAMIAWLGHLMHASGVKETPETAETIQRFRTDDVDVTWLNG